METEISLCAETHQENSNIPSGKIILSVNRPTNLDRDRTTEKLKLPVGIPTKIVSLTVFPCVVTHKKIRLRQVKGTVENHFPVGPSRQGNLFSLSVPHQCYRFIRDGCVLTEN